MKTKIVGILVCMLLIATLAIPISALNKEYEPQTIGADVPVWEVGDSWTYYVDYFESDDNETLIYTLEGSLTFEVTDDSGDSYILEGTGRPLGVIQYGNIGLRTSFLSRVTYDMKMRKSDLGFEYANYYLKGICWLTLGGIPLPVPIQIHGFKNTDFTPIQGFMPFPLTDGDSGTIPSIDFHIVTGTSLFWGIIPITDVDSTWGCEDLDYTVTADQITVPAGEFDVYAVEAENYVEDHYNSWYCEEVGNVVKENILIYVGETSQVYLSMDMELEETTYES
jgi:hypothetical protein